MTTLREQGITSRGSGKRWTQTCPQCSHSRKKSKDPCLSVVTGPNTTGDGKFLETGLAVFRCHHCGWRGIADDRHSDQRKRDAFGRGSRLAGGKGAGPRPMRTSRDRKPPRSRWEI